MSMNFDEFLHQVNVNNAVNWSKGKVSELFLNQKIEYGKLKDFLRISIYHQVSPQYFHHT